MDYQRHSTSCIKVGIRLNIYNGTPTDAIDTIREAKYVENWPNSASAWAGWRRFDIPVDKSDGVHSLLIFTSCTYTGSLYLPMSEPPGEYVLLEQNIKRRTGQHSYVLSLLGYNSDMPTSAMQLNQFHIFFVAYQFLMKKGNIFFISLNIYMLSTRCA
jgi:hypothetical protein